VKAQLGGELHEGKDVGGGEGCGVEGEVTGSWCGSLLGLGGLGREKAIARFGVWRTYIRVYVDALYPPGP
jgi:hypothetical protein